MTAEVKRKFNSRRGASVVLALFLLLVCTFAGTAALTAARANVGRHAGARDVQEKYLSATSAARLMIDELQKANGKISFTYTPTTNAGYEHIGFEDDPSSLYYLLCNDIKTVMRNAVWETMHLEPEWSGFSKSTRTLEKHSFVLHVKDKSNNEDKSFEEVPVDCEIIDSDKSNGGNIEVTSKCGDYVFTFVMQYSVKVEKATGICEFSVQTEVPEIRPKYNKEESGS